MDRQLVHARAERLKKLSAKTRVKIKNIFKEEVLRPFLRKTKKVKDPEKLIQILTAVLLDSKYAERITQIRIEENKTRFFANRYKREMLRIKKEYDKSNP